MPLGRIGLHRYDASRPVQAGAHHSTQAGRAGAQNSHRVPLPDLTKLGRPEAGGKDVAGEQGLAVGDAIRDPGQTVVRVGHPDILRLSPVDAAAQSPVSGGIGAVIDRPPLAEEARPAEGLHIDGHPVAGGHSGHLWAHLLHNAHHLMSYDDPGLCPGHEAAFYMQVTGTDGGQRHSHHRIPWVQDLRDRALFQGKAPLFPIDHSPHHVLHFKPLLSSRWGAMRRHSPLFCAVYHNLPSLASTPLSADSSAWFC